MPQIVPGLKLTGNDEDREFTLKKKKFFWTKWVEILSASVKKPELYILKARTP